MNININVRIKEPENFKSVKDISNAILVIATTDDDKYMPIGRILAYHFIIEDAKLELYAEVFPEFEFLDGVEYEGKDVGIFFQHILDTHEGYNKKCSRLLQAILLRSIPLEDDNTGIVN